MRSTPLPSLAESEALVGQRVPLTREEAARFLRVAPKTIDRWTRAGLLRARRVGNRVLVDVREVARIIRDGLYVVPGTFRRSLARSGPTSER